MEDPKDIVKNAYDNIAPWYLNWVENDRSPRERYTAKLLNDCPSSASVLDLGCGPGVPVFRILLDGGANVTGCDISSKQLELAKAKFPEATLIQSDMASLSFDPSSFDGIACFYTFFHLPRSEQEFFLTKIFSWLKPGGMYVMNCAMFDEEEIHGEFLGWGTFWSGFGVEDNKAMLGRVGFEIVKEELVQSGDGQLEEDDPDYGVEFWWVAARRPVESAGKVGAGEGEVNSSKTSP
ncbi:hypothetical protein PRZ48_014032 [Zasmidium cellare]|uniref:Methyltransferase domain-containing protein n=1 Tax=Zasmidium cellare TaxID=395010 RepID=A0ABR0E0A2_ZASCE|nr:hypothetical protein PRZ48_014032 [Zasmidium cellare]